MYSKIFRAIFGLAILIIALSCFSCTNENTTKNQITLDSSVVQGDLIIFHAGSMTYPLKKVFTEFEKVYPHVNIIAEVSGSNSAANRIIEQNKKCDVLISSDYSIIESILIPSKANWQISFASNELVLAYNDQSRFVDSIGPDNWYRVLLHDKVHFGRADPDTDPCGYRTVICIKLSEIYYDNNGIKDQLLFKDKQYMKPKDVELLTSLNNGEIDYAFIYKSLALDMNLAFVELPEKISLKSPSLASYYSQAKVKVSGNAPGKYFVRKGAPIQYGITTIRNSPNPRGAEAFISFFINENTGLKYLKKSFLPIFDSISASPIDSLPDVIRLQLTRD